jgi:arsenite oxidase small subunit
VTQGQQGLWPCLSRRAFLLGGASVVTLTTLRSWAGTFEVKHYPRTHIASLSDILSGDPLAFQYPSDSPFATNILVKLGEEAGGGVGPDRDIVAFSQFCTHMGGPLAGTYKAEHKVLGPCPFHLTTFDLTRHGMVISGHATESLPQIMLEVDGGEIYATGVMGLLYGHTTST